MKNAYTPSRVLKAEAEPGRPIALTVQNRFNFTDLGKVRIAWELHGRAMGVVTSGSVLGSLIGMFFLATLAPLLGNYALNSNPTTFSGWPSSAS